MSTCVVTLVHQGLFLPSQKPYFDEPGCTIHIDIYYTVRVLVTVVFLKMSPRIRNM